LFAPPEQKGGRIVDDPVAGRRGNEHGWQAVGEGGSMKRLARIAGGAAAWIAATSPLSAVTCEDVRRLTPAERAYWIERLKLTPADVQQIRLACSAERSQERTIAVGTR
jgi:hypothetical protein